MYLLSTKQLIDIARRAFSGGFYFGKENIFVLGQQKSGTTAISGLLSHVSKKSCLLDHPHLWEPNISLIASGELSLNEVISDNWYDFQKKIIKEPNLTYLYSDVKNLYPRGIFLLVVRYPRDNIRSLLNRINIGGKYNKLDQDVFNSIQYEWKIIFNRNLYNIQYEHYIDILAERWNIATDVYLNHQDKVKLVRYEDFKVDKKGYIEALATDLGLQIKKDISKLVNKQYQPAGNSSVSYLDFFGEENLNRINTICGSRMKQLGY